MDQQLNVMLDAWIVDGFVRKTLRIGVGSPLLFHVERECLRFVRDALGEASSSASS